MNGKPIRHLLSAGILGLAMATAGTAQGEDTEIYLSTGAPAGDAVLPNVLFVLDTSGSMTNTDGTGITRLDRMKTALHTILNSPQSNAINVGLMRFHHRGGPVLYPVSYINEMACEVEGNCPTGGTGLSGAQTVVQGIASGSDDAEQIIGGIASGVVLTGSEKLDVGSVTAGGSTTVEVRVNSGVDDVEEGPPTLSAVNLTSSDLELVQESTEQTIGLRFQNVTVPAGATIVEAHVEFEIDEPGTGAINLDMWGQAVDDAPGFASTAGDVSTRARTVAKVDWDLIDDPADHVFGNPPNNGNHADQTLNTPDLSSIVKEIVDRGVGGNPGAWSSGNDMAFIIAKDSGTGKRVVESSNKSGGFDPVLHITYNTGGSDTSLAIAVATGNDDAEEGQTFPGVLSDSSTDLELLKDGSSVQIIGIRFRDVNIPQGSIITGAEIEFTVDETKAGENGNAAVDIWAEDGDAPRDGFAFNFPSFDKMPGNRVLTGARVDWDNMAFPDVGDALTTPDLASLVQEVVDSSNWDPADDAKNDLVFVIKNDPNTGDGNRTVESYNGAPGSAPLLRVTYQSAVAGTNTQVLGLRYQNVRIPQGATITSAYLEFTSALLDADATKLKIWGEDVDDSAAFTAGGPGSNGISGRTRTPTSVDWNPTSTPALATWNAVDITHATPDLAAIVQEIVNRGGARTSAGSGWCGGNDMTFLVAVDTGSAGKRSAFSFEGDTTKAPTLHVTYDPDTPQTDANGCSSSTIQASVLTSADDAEQHSDGSMDLTSSDLEMTQETDAQTIGIRFQDLAIPQAATIISAKLTFAVDEVGSDATSLLIKGELDPDASIFGNNANDITNRTTTTASVAWNSTTTPALTSWDSVDDEHDTPDITSIVQEVVNQTDWAPGNAMAFVVSGTGKRVAHSFDFGSGTGPRLTVTFQGDIPTVVTTVRDRLNQVVDQIQPRSGTPILGALTEAAYYYRGEPVVYGKTRGPQTDSDRYTRVSHPASYSGATGVFRDASCTDQNLNNVACKTEEIQGDAKYKSPIVHECQESFIILLSDGNGYVTSTETGTYDPRPRVDTITGTDCGNDHDTCAAALTGYLNGNDQITSASQVLAEGTAPLDDNQLVHTYTIGFNLGSTSPDFLADIATAGGGQFFSAASADQLASVFTTIFTEILKTTTSFASPSLTVNAFNRLFNRDEVYFSLFEPDNHRRWPGNVKKYKLCSDPATQSCELGEVLDATGVPAIDTDNKVKDDAQSVWSPTQDGKEITTGGSGDLLEAVSYTSRVAYTDVGLASHPASPVALDDVSGDYLISTDDDHPVRDAMCADPTNGNTACNDLIEWVLGRDVADEDGDSNTTEERWKFQDPLHSSPVAITYGKGTDSNGVTQFIDKVFVGTNEGGVRMLNGFTGVEEWVFMPQALLSNQTQLFTNGEGDHVYGMDGTPQFVVQDVDADGTIEPADGDFVHMYVSMRRGGRNIYALDVTPSSTLTDPEGTNDIAPKFMWRIEGGVSDTSGNFSRLGYTFSDPLVTLIRVKKVGGGSGDSEPKVVLIFGGGYDLKLDDGFGHDPLNDTSTANLGNAIYIVDADTGTLIHWISSDASANIVVGDSDIAPDPSGTDPETVQGAGMKYAIASQVAALDSDGDGESDRLYVGDTAGNVWRVDLGATLASNDSAGTVVGKLASVSVEGTASAERRFFYPPDVVQVVDSIYSGTDRYDMVVIGTGNRSHPLNKDVQDRFYALRDKDVEGMTGKASKLTIADNYPQSNDRPFTDSDLTDVTDNLLQDGDETEVSNALTALRAGDGWRLDLEANGEKVLAAPVVLAGKLFFTTYLPEAAVAACAAQEGAGNLYGIDVLNAKAVIDWTTDDNYTKEDRIYSLGGGIPSEAVPVFQKEGVTLLIGGGGGATSVDPGITLPRQRTYWYQE